jgi:PmbA protein
MEDPWLPRALGSRPVDGEGRPTSRLPLIDGGVLTTFLYDTRTARRDRTRSTGSAVRGYATLPGPGAHAPRLQPGDRSPEEILEMAGKGLYVTQLLGFGTNLVTGDYSRGANGWWFEEGEFAYPVQEVTLSGNLREMLQGIALVGDDLVPRSAAASPTFLIESMVISGGAR